VDFGKRGAKKFTAELASVEGGCSIEIRLDSQQGPVVGKLDIPSTGGPKEFRELSCPVKGAKGIHDLVFVFRGKTETNLMNWNQWEFDF
jgi:hypothetical protein